MRRNSLHHSSRRRLCWQPAERFPSHPRAAADKWFRSSWYIIGRDLHVTAASRSGMRPDPKNTKSVLRGEGLIYSYAVKTHDFVLACLVRTCRMMGDGMFLWCLPPVRFSPVTQRREIKFAEAGGGEGGRTTPARSPAYERKPSLEPFSSALTGPQSAPPDRRIHFPGKGHSCTRNHQHTLVHIHTNTWLSFLLVRALPSTSASHDKAIISDSLLQEMHCVIRRRCSDSTNNILAGFSNNPYSRLLVRDYTKLSFSLSLSFWSEKL